MKKLELLKKELLGEEVTIQEMEELVASTFDISDKDSIFNDNLYLAFVTMNHNYELFNDTWVNITFKVDFNEDSEFDIYNDKILITDIDYILLTNI